MVNRTNYALCNLSILIIVISMTVSSYADSPSFDCLKVTKGSIEELICKNQDLSAMDVTLAEVYKQAQEKAKNEHPPTLKAEQRGWIKERNECLNSDDKQKCVEDAYIQRITELQARYKLVNSNGPIFYECDDIPSKEIVLTFFETDPPTLIAEFGDSVSLMYIKPSASGSKYQGRNESAWIKGDEAIITWGYGAPEMNCKQRPNGN